MIGHNFKSEDIQFVFFRNRMDNLLQFFYYAVYEDTFAVFRYPNEVVVAEIFRVPRRVVVLVLHTIDSMTLSI